MSKRITSERVKKWATTSGIVGVPLAVLMIWFIASLGAFNITGFSGDVICAGTELDPCYAYINFSVKEDVFIYSSEEWGSTAFYTDPQPKSVQMYRSWGNSWREIKLNQSCTGTWCGLSNSKDTRVFSFAFREGNNYQIRYKVLKENPEDDVKWGFTKEVDPTFLGITSKNVFVELIKSEGGISSGEAIYKINLPYELDKEDLLFSFELAKGNPINYYDLFYWAKQKVKVPTYEEKQIQIPCPKTNTTKDKEIELTYCYETEKIETGYADSIIENWIKIDKLPPGENIIKMVAYWDAHTGEQIIDWKPIILLDKDKYFLEESIVLEKPEWAWFNSSWSKCRNISIQASATKNNYPMIKNDFTAINLTGLTFSSTNEIRIVNDSCNGGGIEMPYDVIQNGSTWAEVIFLANVTNGNVTYSVYYNFTGAPAPSFTTDLNCSATNLENNHFDTVNGFGYDAGAGSGEGGSTLVMKIKQGSNVDFVKNSFFGGGDGQFDATGSCSLTFNGNVMDKVTCTATDGSDVIDWRVYANNPYVDSNVKTNAALWAWWVLDIWFNGSTANSLIHTKAGALSACWGDTDPVEGWAFTYNTSITNEVFGGIWNYSYTGANNIVYCNAGAYYVGWRVGDNPVNTPQLVGTGYFFNRQIIGTLDDVADPIAMENVEVALFVDNPFNYSVGAEESAPPSANCWTKTAGKIIIPPTCQYYINAKDFITP